MAKSNDVLLFLAWAAGAVVLGTLLCFPLFSYLPFFWGVGLALVYFVALATFCVTRRNLTSTAYAAVGSTYTAAFAIVIILFTGVERTEHFECNWKIASDGIEIDLRPAGGFGRPLVNAAELEKHLKHSNPPRVKVELRITRDLGQARARGRIERVDGFGVRELGW